MTKCLEDAESAKSNFNYLNQLPFGFCIVREDHTVIFWNRTMEEWSLVASDEIVGANLFDRFPTLKESKYIHRISNVFESNIPVVFSSQLHKYVFPFYVKNKKPRIQKTVVQPILLPGSSDKKYILFCIEDVTDMFNQITTYKNMRDKALQQLEMRRKAENALAEAVKLNKKLIDSLPHPILLTNMDRKIVLSNQIARSLGAEEGKYCWDSFTNLAFISEEDRLDFEENHIIPPGGINCSFCKADQCMKTGCKADHFGLEAHGKKWDVSWVPIDKHTFLHLFVDVTERISIEEKKKEEALSMQLVQAQKMEAIGNLAGGVAHDFNNMLTVILASANLLQLKKNTDDPDCKDLCLIVDAVESAKDLTMKLLTFARRDKLDVRIVSIHDIINKFSDMLGRSISKQIRIVKNIIYNANVQVDLHQIQHALLNICNNAVDAMPDGGVLTLETALFDFVDEACYTCGKNLNGRYCRISISDTGGGMPSNILQRITEPFFTTKGVGKGTGLGLSVTLGIIESHNGHLHIYSEINKGTCVRVYLPVETSVTVKPDLTTQDMVLTGCENILVVDDEPSVLLVSERILLEMGYTPILAESGAKAIELYRSRMKEIDLVILDMMMPVIDGKETFEVLKEINPHVKVLISSGFSIDGQASDVLKNGAMGFVQKPYRIQAMFETIRKVLD